MHLFRTYVCRQMFAQCLSAANIPQFTFCKYIVEILLGVTFFGSCCGSCVAIMSLNGVGLTNGGWGVLAMGFVQAPLREMFNIEI